MNNQTIGYHPGDSFVYRINATAKLLFFILVSVACMTTYDTRFLLGVSISSIILFKFADIKWDQISFVVKFIVFFSLLNLLTVYVFQPNYGEQLYQTKHVMISGIGRFDVTQEELFYLLNLLLKYVCTIPLALLFLMTTNPSNFAASLNRIGLSYKISYSVSLALRYIPDIQEDFFSISQAQQARGFEMSKKGKLSDRIKGIAQIILPLIFSSLDRIDSISTAMELRRFGQKSKRTWYVDQPFLFVDCLVILIAISLFGLTLWLMTVNGGRFYNPFQSK